jgi:hypothetical protein
VADPGCLSRIPDPDFYPSRIPDPKRVPKERGEKKFVIILFFSHKFHKIEYYVIFEMLKKKILANFQRIVEVFTQNIFNMLSNIWVWDPGSEIRDPEKTYSGSRIQGSKRHRIPQIRIRNTDLFLEYQRTYNVRFCTNFLFEKLCQINSRSKLITDPDPELFPMPDPE